MRRPAALPAPWLESLDTRKNIAIILRFCQAFFLRIQEERVPRIGISVRLLLRLAALFLLNRVVAVSVPSGRLPRNQRKIRARSRPLPHADRVPKLTDFAFVPSSRDFHP